MVLKFLPQSIEGNIDLNQLNPPQRGGLRGNITPPTPFTEGVEEVATVIDDLIYNETGGGNDGQVEVLEV